MRANAAVWFRHRPLRASLVLVLALLAAASCTWDDDNDDEGDDDDEDVPAAWAPDRTPPGAVTPSYDASPGPAYDASPEAAAPESGESSESGGSADDGAASACDSGVPEGSAEACAWRAGGLCFDQAEPACACAGCSLAQCSLVNPTAALDAPLDVACGAPPLSAPPSASDAGPDA